MEFVLFQKDHVAKGQIVSVTIRNYIKLEIPYSSIIKIQNANEEEMAGFLFIEPIGTWWKKNHRYTVIQYKNDIDTQTIVIDLEKY